MEQSIGSLFEQSRNDFLAAQQKIEKIIQMLQDIRDTEMITSMSKLIPVCADAVKSLDETKKKIQASAAKEREVDVIEQYVNNDNSLNEMFLYKEKALSIDEIKKQTKFEFDKFLSDIGE